MNNTAGQNDNVPHIKQVVNHMQSYVAIILIQKHVCLHSDRTMCIKLKIEF